MNERILDNIKKKWLIPITEINECEYSQVELVYDSVSWGKVPYYINFGVYTIDEDVNVTQPIWEKVYDCFREVIDTKIKKELLKKDDVMIYPSRSLLPFWQLDVRDGKTGNTISKVVCKFYNDIWDVSILENK